MTVKTIKELLFAALSWPHGLMGTIVLCCCYQLTLTPKVTSFRRMLEQQMSQIRMPADGVARF